jgi:hypothetical protein
MSKVHDNHLVGYEVEARRRRHGRAARATRRGLVEIRGAPSPAIAMGEPECEDFTPCRVHERKERLDDRDLPEDVDLEVLAEHVELHVLHRHGDPTPALFTSPLGDT